MYIHSFQWFLFWFRVNLCIVTYFTQIQILWHIFLCDWRIFNFGISRKLLNVTLTELHLAIATFVLVSEQYTTSQRIPKRKHTLSICNIREVMNYFPMNVLRDIPSVTCELSFLFACLKSRYLLRRDHLLRRSTASQHSTTILPTALHLDVSSRSFCLKSKSLRNRSWNM